MIGASRLAAAGRGLALALAVAAATAPAAAQESAEARVRRLEAEVRALQRQVFPGGSGRFFEPEIRPPAAGPGTPLPPSSGAVTDLLARVDSVEAQLARLTAQIEETGNLARGLQARLATLESAGVALAVAEDPAQAAPSGQTGLVPSGPPPAQSAGALPRPVLPRPTLPGTMLPGTVPTDRAAALRTITRPDTGDAGDDAYTYGFRLWDAGLYPEAAKQLQATLDQYPRHKRVSYTRNLLGRAYLDDGKPGTAAQVFLQNYQADRTGARAPDSLLYLAMAMTRLNETGRACVALQELSEGFPAEVAGRLGPEYQAARAAVTCDR